MSDIESLRKRLRELYDHRAYTAKESGEPLIMTFEDYLLHIILAEQERSTYFGELVQNYMGEIARLENTIYGKL